MTEYRYQIQVSTQLGMRRGTLAWSEEGSILQGTLHFLHRTTPLSGHTGQAGQYSFSGQIETLVSHIPYQADCILTGSSLKGTFRTASGDYSVIGERLEPENSPSEEAI